MSTRHVIRDLLRGQWLIGIFLREGQPEKVSWGNEIRALKFSEDQAREFRAAIINLPQDKGGALGPALAVEEENLLPQSPTTPDRVVLKNGERFYAGHTINGDQIITTWGGVMAAKTLTREQAETFREVSRQPHTVIAPVPTVYIQPSKSVEPQRADQDDFVVPRVEVKQLHPTPKMKQRYETVAGENRLELDNKVNEMLATGAALHGSQYFAYGQYIQVVIHSELADE